MVRSGQPRLQTSDGVEVRWFRILHDDGSCEHYCIPADIKHVEYGKIPYIHFYKTDPLERGPMPSGSRLPDYEGFDTSVKEVLSHDVHSYTVTVTFNLSA
jgi:hypothetical protein